MHTCASEKPISLYFPVANGHSRKTLWKDDPEIVSPVGGTAYITLLGAQIPQQ
jgi:hypothetical protein